MKTILFVSANNIGDGLSGGDRIFVELVRHWRARLHVLVLGAEETLKILQDRDVTEIDFLCADSRNASTRQNTIGGMIRHAGRRVRKATALLRAGPSFLREADYVYSASDFFPDFFPAYRLKRAHPDIQWIAGYYLFVPPPWDAQTPYRGREWLRGLLYWMMQRVSYRLVRGHADVVFVTSEPDVRHFPPRADGGPRVVVVQGGVDIAPSEEYLRSAGVVPVDQRTYDGCFVGRLHYQKGVRELVDIWQHVTRVRPNARLALIGIGPLEDDVRRRIAERGLQDRVDMLGFRDGERKYEIFRQSRVMLHPATYDSGGMAAAEGMAWQLPGVSFDLEALKTYYPKGMLKAPPGDCGDFARQVLALLDDKALYERTAKDAYDLTREVWDWERRAERVYQAVFEAKGKG